MLTCALAWPSSSPTSDRLPPATRTARAAECRSRWARTVPNPARVAWRATTCVTARLVIGFGSPRT